MQAIVGDLQHESQTTSKIDQLEMQRHPERTQKYVVNISSEVQISIQQFNSADLVDEIMLSGVEQGVCDEISQQSTNSEEGLWNLSDKIKALIHQMKLPNHWSPCRSKYHS